MSSKVAQIFEQLQLLLANIVLIKLRSWRTTLSELLLPLVFFVAFNSPGLGQQPRQIGSGSVIEFNSSALGPPDLFQASPLFPPQGPFSSLYVPQEWAPGVSRTKGGPGPALIFAPNTSASVNQVMQVLAASAPALPHLMPLHLIGLKDEEEVIRRYDDQPMSVWAAIVFKEDGEASRNWRYSLRLNGTWAPSSKPEDQLVKLGGLSGGSPDGWVRYQQTGFALLQYCVDQAILQVSSNGKYIFRSPASLSPEFTPEVCFDEAHDAASDVRCTVDAAVGFQRQPQIEDDTEDMLWILKWLPGWCLNVSAVFWLSSSMLPLVSEHKLKVPMRVMGMRDISYQLAWLLAAVALAAPMACCFAALWDLVNVTHFSSFWIVALFLYFYLSDNLRPNSMRMFEIGSRIY